MPGSIPSSFTSMRLPGLVLGQSLGLTTRAIQREHELGTQPLSQRVLRDERAQLSDQVGVAPEREIRLDPLLQYR